MSAADVHSILYRGEDILKDNFSLHRKPVTRPPRHWPGRAPDYAIEEEEYEEIEEDYGNKDTELQDKRLARIYRLEELNNSEDRKNRERCVINRVLEHDEDEKADKLQDPSANKIKDRDEIRRINLLKRKEEEEKLLISAQNIKDEEDIEEESSEYDTESDCEDPAANAVMKPIFVPKQKRETVKEKELIKLEEAKKEELNKKRLEERKTESHKLLIDVIRAEEQQEVITNGLAVESDVELPDDSDDVNQAEEYELWKIRELKRIKRDKEELETRAILAADIERRRRMTEDERRQDNKILDANAPKKEVKYKLNFMQKYYHKGAFFQDKALTGEEPLYLRDYNAPVGEDKMDKKILPKAMRLRRGQFGRQGQVKHTHLVDVDTTDFSTPWTQIDQIRIKYFQQMAGVKGDQVFSRPSKKK